MPSVSKYIEPQDKPTPKAQVIIFNFSFCILLDNLVTIVKGIEEQDVFPYSSKE
jgi:hypothetical protein